MFDPLAKAGSRSWRETAESVKAGGSELQADVHQETPQAELRFVGKTFALAEQEPLFLMTSSGQFREGAQGPQRTRGHKRQCWELWEHI